MSQKTVRHANKALRKGFTILPNVLLLDPALSAGALRTYAVFTHLAWAPESDWPGQDELGPKFLGVKDAKTVRKWITDLEERGLLSSTRRGRGLTNLYEVHLPEDQAEVQNGKNPRSGTGKNPPAEREESTGPNREHLEDAPGGASDDAPPVAEDTPQPPAGGKVVRFRGRQVPLDVYCTAVALLESFNTLAGTSYAPLTGSGRPTESLKRLFGAILDHPEISLELGERMIRIQLADPYWQGRPQPGNVFGPGVLERNIEAASWTTQQQGNRAASLVNRLDARRAA